LKFQKYGGALPSVGQELAPGLARCANVARSPAALPLITFGIGAGGLSWRLCENFVQRISGNKIKAV